MSSKTKSQNERYGNVSQSASTMRGTAATSSSTKKKSKSSRDALSSTNKPFQMKPECIFLKDLIKEMISHSAEIGEFHLVHKKNQKKFEDRKVKKELTFIEKDYEFNGALDPNSNSTWRFISNLHYLILSVDDNGMLTIYSCDCNYKRTINLTNFYERDSTIIACELYENISTFESKLLLLYDNFNFCYIDLMILLKNIMNDVDNTSTMMIKLFNSKSSYFNMKAYLHLPEVETYTPDVSNGIRLITYPQSAIVGETDIIINFTQIANRIIVFNLKSFSVVETIIINPETYSNVDREFSRLIKIFVKKFFTKRWSRLQMDYFYKLVNDINKDQKQFDKMKQLSALLESECGKEGNELNVHVLSSLNKYSTTIKDDIILCPTLYHNNVNVFYTEVVSPLIYYSLFTMNVLNVYNVINKLKDLFEKLKSTSIACCEGDLNFVNGGFGVYQKLFMQCHLRNISLIEKFKEADKEHKGYCSKDDADIIFHNLSIGLTEKDIDDIKSIYYIFDDSNNYMYEYLLELEEMLITDLMLISAGKDNENKVMPNKKKEVGFFKEVNEEYDIEFTYPIIKRKASFDFDACDNKDKHISSLSSLPIDETDIVIDRICQYLINSCFKSEVTDIVYVKQLNLFFVISPYDNNVSIFKGQTQSIQTTPSSLIKIGHIPLQSHNKASPLFLFYIKERNMLITQEITSECTNLIIIDIYKDIINNLLKNESSSYIVVNIKQNHNRIRNVIPKEHSTYEESSTIIYKPPHAIKYFNCLYRNELFVIGTENKIVLLNPKSHPNELSFQIEPSHEDVYAKLCRTICEYPCEKAGDDLFKQVRVFKLETPFEKIITFNIGGSPLSHELKAKYFSSDWLVVFNENNEIFSHSISQLYITLKAKEIDSPIPEEHKSILKKYCLNQLYKSIALYKTELLPYISTSSLNSYNTYAKLLESIAYKVKDTILYTRELNLLEGEYNLIKTMNTSHDIMRLIKDLNLPFEKQTYTKLFPQLQIEEPKYEQNAEYFKTELFPSEKGRNVVYNNDDNNLPKRQLKVNNDISAFESQVTPVNSAIKKFAYFCFEKKMKIENIFAKCDTNHEDIIYKEHFINGIRKLGMKEDFITKTELDALCAKIGRNNAGCLSNDEFKKFFSRNDFDHVVEKAKNENDIRNNDDVIKYNPIKEVIQVSPQDRENKINEEVIMYIENIYKQELEVVSDDEVAGWLKIIETHIKQNNNKYAMKFYFKNGFIFMNEFHKFIRDVLKIDESMLKNDDISQLFLFLDKNNKNCFLYVDDLASLLHFNIHNVTIPVTTRTFQESQYMINEKEYLLILVSILKKFIKLCITNFEILPTEFTDAFLFAHKINKSVISMDTIPTKKLKDKINNKLILNEIEQKILFDYYIDIFNFELLFKNEVQIKIDKLMGFISDSGVFDFNLFDTPITLTEYTNDNVITHNNTNNNNTTNQRAYIYLNETKQNLLLQQKYFSHEHISKTMNIPDTSTLALIHYSQRIQQITNLTSLYNLIQTYDSDHDLFLTQKEFHSFLKKHLLPQSMYSVTLAQSLINRYSEYISFPNESTRPYISINRFILNLYYTIKRQQEFNTNTYIHDLSFHISNDELMRTFNEEMFTLRLYDSIGTELVLYSEDYLKRIKEGSFSGFIILSKSEECVKIISELDKAKGVLNDYINMYKQISNEMLIDKFNERIKSINNPNNDSNNNNIENIEEDIDYSLIEIPKIRINIVDSREMINRKRYECDFIENFDFYHNELNTVVNITKIRKTFLLNEVSNDGQNLLNHIEASLKVNHYLQQIYFNNEANTKDDFPFIRNFGIFIKEVIIDKKVEEEYYIINEKINHSDFISMSRLIKSNGGLLQIPELANTDMAFYILRFWGKKIIDIISTLHKMNISLRYFTLNDFYISKDGKKVKMKNLLHYSFTNLQGDLFNGPDLAKIFIILNEIPHSDISELPIEKLNEVYDDPYLCPDFLLMNPSDHTYRIDTWAFGICLFNLLYGYTPISFYTQLKNWCFMYSNIDFNNVILKFPCELRSKHFFFNPFMNVKEIVEEDPNYFSKVIKMNSYSAVVKTKYLNLSTENNMQLNGLGIILDMINACLSITPSKRPTIFTLSKCDLFIFDQYESILCNKFLDNVLNYYSPEIIIEKNMLIPLRDICADVIKNSQAHPLEINNYENFIFQTIRDINTYLFSKDFIQPTTKGGITTNSTSANEMYDDIEIEEDSHDSGKNIFVKNPEYYFKNSMIIKSIIENQIFDLLIFLVLKHFHANLVQFKSVFQKQLKDQIKENSKTLDIDQKIKLSASKRSNYKTEMSKTCGRLITALCDLLTNCVTAMSSYDHMLTLYVEDILIYVIKLFIGEPNQLLSEICDMKHSKDELHSYLLQRTFLRNDKVVLKPFFTEDECDKVFSIANNNIDLCEIKSLWCPELYQFTIELFRETFGENCSGTYRHIVIKKYFTTVNDCSKNISNRLENSLVNNKIKDYLSVIQSTSQMQFHINHTFLTSEYVNEILSLAECSMNVRCLNGMMPISERDSHIDQTKNLVNKRNALSYIFTLFKSKNEFKVRACLDFKIHFFISSFLFTNASDYAIKNEVFNIFKEISINLTDVSEIAWMFGNNYNTIFNNNHKSKTDTLDISDSIAHSNWDSNFSLIDFMNKLLNQPHSFILYFTDRFLGINAQCANNTVAHIYDEFGLIFSSPLILKPLMQTLQKTKENIFLRQSCLDILVNLLLSNNQKIISNFNMTMCNFYEVITSLIKSCITQPEYLKPRVEETNDIISKAKDHFKINVRQIVKILIELQNPFIKKQMFSCASMVKYMEQNNMQYVERLEIDEIENEFKKLLNLFNFISLEDKIIFLINAFKSFVLNSNQHEIDSNRERIRTIINTLNHILSNEWSEGLKQRNKNCLVFNIIKLFEWIMKKNYYYFLFPTDNESEAMQMLISLLTKVREANINMRDIITEITKMNVSIKTTKLASGNSNTTLTSSTKGMKTARNISKSKKANTSSSQNINKPKSAFSNSMYILQKIYNFISIKMLNIVSLIFERNEDYYNNIFAKVKFGSIFSELLKTQYQCISLFLNEENIDISIIDNYMVENRLRIHLFEIMMNLSQAYDSIKLQFLQSEFIQFLFSSLAFDFRKFRTDYKKLSVEFLAYKHSFPLRSEALSMMNIVMKKINNVNMKTEIDAFIYDEMIRNMKIAHMVQNELAIIKNKIKGYEVNAVLSFFNIVLANKNDDVIKMMEIENAKDYFVYAINKDTELKKVYPLIVKYVNVKQAGMDFE